MSQPIYRVLMGKAFNLLVQAVLLPGIWDTQCGFKLFRADIAKPVFAALTTDGFGYDPEVLYLAKRRGVKIAEVPVVWRHSAPTKVLPRSVAHSIDMFKHVVRVRFHSESVENRVTERKAARQPRCSSSCRRSTSG